MLPVELHTPMRVGGLKSWRWLRDLALLAVAVFAIRAYQQRDLPRGAAPALSGIGLDGWQLSLDDYRGRPVLLHFWATWCGVCRAEQSSIDSIARELPVLSVASRSGSADQVSSFVQQHGVVPPVVVDAPGALAKRYGIHAYPTTLVLNESGEIQFCEVGYTTELGLRARMWFAGL
ncbi:MAG TPA: redoxin family protein [Polyangiales bacterium]|nr:redoxin family protein [Polyangiales bacterium]